MNTATDKQIALINRLKGERVLLDIADDGDEQGFRLYVVIGNVDTLRPTIVARVGVYGHYLDINPSVIFDDLGPFHQGAIE